MGGGRGACVCGGGGVDCSLGAGEDGGFRMGGGWVGEVECYSAER